MWRIRYVDYDINASKRGQKLWRRLFYRVPEPKRLLEIREKCNCGDWPLHNNGGSYHLIWTLYELDDEHVLLVQRSTRESFSCWEQGFIYIYSPSSKKEYVVWSEVIQDVWARVMDVEEAKKEIESLLNDEEVYIAEGEENLAKILTS
jgi:hypothetical protein